jgi:predicted MFS family arabinose efflux permease
MSANAAADTQPVPNSLSSARLAWASGLLLLIYVLNYVDRIIISVLGEPIKAELGLSDTEIGILSGIGFSLLYSLVSFPLARMSDRGSRTRLITVCLVIWSVFTMASGWARNAVQLFTFRLGVGVGEAGYAPAAHSLLSDYYPPHRRAFALGIFQIGAPVGIMIGSFGGGWLASEIGWRMTFVAAGLPGLFLALLAAFTMIEPKRGAHEKTDVAAEPTPPVRDLVAALRKRRSVIYMMAGLTITTIASLGLTQFLVPFFIRVHTYSLAEASVMLGIVAGLAGAIGALAGGYFGDRLGSRDPRNYGRIAIAGTLMAFPLYLGGLLQSSPLLGICLMFFGPAGFFLGAPVTYVVVQNLMPPRMRATMAALLLTMMALLGGLGPVATGWLIDTFAHLNFAQSVGGDYAAICGQGGSAIAACREALSDATRMGMVLTTLLLPISAACYALAIKHLPADTEKAALG